MNLTVTSKTTAKCSEFLKIIYGETKYSVEEFSAKFKTTDFSLDEKVKDCFIEYRGQSFSYNQMCQNHLQFSESLPFFTAYHEHIYPQEHLIMIGNFNYYKSAKFLSKAEKCLQTARYYLLNSQNLLTTDYDIHWASGYGPQFMIRTMDFTTAVVWYNNCFDYVLQIVYLSFELYKQLRDYKDSWSFEKILKQCSYTTINDIYTSNSTANNFTTLWNIIKACQNSLRDVNSWANFIKHKGGINFVGLTADEPFHATVRNENGDIVAESGDFDAIKIDLDSSILKLQSTHNALCECLTQLVAFIDYTAAVPQSDSTGERMLIPDKSQYVKIILP